MGDFKINEKSVITQSGSAEPVLSSNLVFPAGHCINKTYYSIGRGTNTGASFPNDNTIPQRDEGTEIYSQSYTPSTTSCNIFITTNVRVTETSNVNAGMQLGLFISDSDDALIVGETDPDAGTNPNGGNILLMHSMPGWAGAKILSLRSGGGNCFNYSNEDTGYGVEKYGLAFTSAFIVEEIQT
tara:strand:+ start:6088 stop:6639 length:552 start_codon:yes stop_codon:yes gene_type:complete